MASKTIGVFICIVIAVGLAFSAARASRAKECEIARKNYRSAMAGLSIQAVQATLDDRMVTIQGRLRNTSSTPATGILLSLIVFDCARQCDQIASEIVALPSVVVPSNGVRDFSEPVFISDFIAPQGQVRFQVSIDDLYDADVIRTCL